MRNLWESENVRGRDKDRDRDTEEKEAIFKMIMAKNFPKLLKYQAKSPIG